MLLTFKLPIELVSGDTPADFIWSLLFLPSDKFPILSVGWTLNFEMYFYLVFAVAIWLNRRYAPLMVAAFVSSIIWLDGKGYGGYLVHYYSNDYLQYFMAGIATYYVWTFTSGFLPRWPTILLCTTVILFCYGSQFVRPAWAGWMPAYLGYPRFLLLPALCFWNQAALQ